MPSQLIVEKAMLLEQEQGTKNCVLYPVEEHSDFASSPSCTQTNRREGDHPLRMPTILLKCCSQVHIYAVLQVEYFQNKFPMKEFYQFVYVLGTNSSRCAAPSSISTADSSLLLLSPAAVPFQLVIPTHWISNKETLPSWLWEKKARWSTANGAYDDCVVQWQDAPQPGFSNQDRSRCDNKE